MTPPKWPSFFLRCFQLKIIFSNSNILGLFLIKINAESMVIVSSITCQLWCLSARTPVVFTRTEPVVFTRTDASGVYPHGRQWCLPAQKPVVFTHTNASGVYPHGRQWCLPARTPVVFTCTDASGVYPHGRSPVAKHVLGHVIQEY